MGSENRRLIVKSKWDFLDYDYEVDGQKYKRQEVIDMILSLLDGKSMTMQELTKDLKINEKSMLNIMKVMRENNMIINTKLRRNGYYLFRTQNDCLLAQLLYPSPTEVEKQFTVKSRKVRKAEQGTSKSAGYGGNVTYSGSHYDLLDW